MLVVIRGAGDIATGIAVRLHRAHMKIIMTEIPEPTAIRRTVCFSEAVRKGSMVVEGICAELAHSVKQAEEIAGGGRIAVLVDEHGSSVSLLRPDVVVDAILAKKNLGTKITDAPLVIGVGPGFAAMVEGVPMVCTIDGILRGILPEGIRVHAGMKSGDIDPRCEREYCYSVSEKALAVGGGVLEAILNLSK